MSSRVAGWRAPERPSGPHLPPPHRMSNPNEVTAEDIRAMRVCLLRNRAYIKAEPHPGPQTRFCASPARELLYGGAAGGGKACRLDEPVPTPHGWATMGSLEVGSELFDEQGQVCRVTHLHPIIPEPVAYRLTFDDGTEVECCEDHSWLTFDASELAAMTRRTPEYRAKRRASRATRGAGKRPDLAQRNAQQPTKAKDAPAGTVRTTRQIVESLRTRGGRANHAIPVASAIQTPTADLPIDPYILGLWLGDGTSRSGQITTADREVVAALAAAGFEPRELTGKYRYGTRGLSPLLRKAGLLQNKHVPAAYLRGDVSQRLELLRGLMDSDGCANANGSVEFTSTNRRLADAVLELAVSLGDKAAIREGRATLRGRDCGPKYRIKWSASVCPFHIKRKADRWRAPTRRTTRFRYIVDAQPVTPSPMRCIAVDSPSRLFLLGRSMVPTHNSIAMVIAALMYVDVPGYSALILRRSFGDFWQDGGIGDVLRDWLGPTDARWNGQEKIWHFPSGAKLELGYTGEKDDILRYQGGERQFLGFDELTQLRKKDYLYLFSRQRRSKLVDVPMRFRAASNPGGPGHHWVMERFVDPGHWQRPFIPARISDNPSLDQEEYLRALDELDPITLAQLRDGDWTAAGGGGMFNRATIPIVDELPPLTGRRPVRAWDLAATDDAAATLRNEDPDYTAGVRAVALDDGCIYITDLVHGRWGPGEVEKIIAQTAKMDGKKTRVRIPQDPGQAGKAQIAHFRANVIPSDVGFISELPSGRKWDRARPAAGLAGNGRIKLVNGPWVRKFLAELEAFSPQDEHDHDDIVDALSDAVATLLPEMKRTAGRTEPPRNVGTAGPPEQFAEAMQGQSLHARDVKRSGLFG